MIDTRSGPRGPRDATPMVGAMSESRLDWHVSNWREWHFSSIDEDGPSHYPGRASGRMGRSASSDFDTMVDTADIHCARAVDAIVESCTPIERSAMYHKHLYAVFRFPHLGAGVDIAYQAAREKIRRGLIARGIP